MTGVGTEARPGIVDRIAEREAKADAGVILTSAYILATMHVDARFARDIFNKVTAMLSSLPGYQLILDEGAAKFARQLILKQGQSKLGEPTDKQKNKLSVIEDPERLERMALKVHTAKSWDSLLRVK